MGSVEKLAEEVRRGLQEALPGLRKTILRKLPFAVAAIVEARTANTAMGANLLPLAVERQDMREQWLRRLLANRLIVSHEVMAPFAKRVLEEAAAHGQTVLLSMDQTDLGERFAVLVRSRRVGDRALPLVWSVESGAANIGFAGQRILLERLAAWLPEGAAVMLLADRFYPSQALFHWLGEHGWQYRLRLKGNLSVDVGRGDLTTTGALAAGVRERYEPHARLFECALPTPIGILHEPGHKEPWIVAMDCPPSRARVLDYGARWGIEPMFSDFKTRGFGLEDTHLQAPERLGRLLLMMALAMYWCVAAGRHDALHHPTPLEKRPGNKPTPTTGRCERSTVPCSRGSNAACACS